MFFKKKQPSVEYPQDIQIETTNRCNARCVFCHHPNMKRPLVDMPDALFEKLIRDMKDMNVRAVHPFVNGEPFLDRKMFARLEYINRALPGVAICLFTNGALLDEEKAAQLAQIKNIDVLNFSLNAFEADDYKKRVGLDFEKTVANIKNILRLNKARAFAKSIMVASVEYGKEDKAKNKAYNDAFRAFCEVEFPGAEIKVGYKYNYLSRVFSFRGFRDIHCARLKGMTVLANGLVSLCCMDMEGEFILGNANERSLLDIYNSMLAREYRRNKKSR
ncbi:MAG: radical SAM protein, partial [Candidatus Omnitrophica bacterium]|nr:radical SAM protein [Candidatus Omnitrophota bacterium]